MTFPPDIMPIEMHGMSIFTALTLTFIAIGFTLGFGFMWGVMKRDFQIINTRLDSHSKKLEERINDISKIRSDMSGMLQSIKNIEKMIEKIYK